jgi:CPA2 family monovalent cation:H+ antiporter-2
VVRGDPTKLPVLDTAGVRTARLVVIAEDEPEDAARIARSIRGYTDARIVVRPVGDVDVDALADAGVDAVVDRETASHRSLAAAVLGELGVLAAPKVDPTRIVRYPLPPEPPCPHSSVVHPVVPSAAGCEECLRTGDAWVHLRVCLSCGHVGCCDSSPNRHARSHFEGAEHPYIASVEPGETWAFCYFDNTTVERPAEAGAAGTRFLEDA